MYQKAGERSMTSFPLSDIAWNNRIYFLLSRIYALPPFNMQKSVKGISAKLSLSIFLSLLCLLLIFSYLYINFVALLKPIASINVIISAARGAIQIALTPKSIGTTKIASALTTIPLLMAIMSAAPSSCRKKK